MSDAPSPASGRVATVPRIVKELYPSIVEKSEEGKGILHALMRKSDVPDEMKSSRQGVAIGRMAQPFNMEATRKFQSVNEYHSACLAAKVSAYVGLGFMSDEERKMADRSPATMTPEDAMAMGRDNTLTPSKVDEVLNPLCSGSWQETLMDVIEDFVQVGNGYLEVVRANPSNPKQITGLHHIPAHEVFVFIEDENYNRHYEVQSNEASYFSSTTRDSIRRFPVFGDKESFMARAQNQMAANGFGFSLAADAKAEEISEVIHFRRPTSLDRWYGYPDWISAVASIELIQMLMQFHFDFFLNRGVPELLVLFLGALVNEENFKEIKDAIMGTVGLTNQHKSVVANLPDFDAENTQVLIQQLAQENSDDGDKFKNMRDTLSLGVVSAHRVPPLLAGIQVPGKLGAANELVNALVLFQLLVAGPAQRLIQQTLGSTLGNAEQNGGLGLTTEDFRLRRITEEMNLGEMSTISQMREPLAQAQANGRDVKDGLRD